MGVPPGRYIPHVRSGRLRVAGINPSVPDKSGRSADQVVISPPEQQPPQSRAPASSSAALATLNDGAPLDRGSYRHSTSSRCPCCGHLDVCIETVKQRARENRARALASGGHAWIRHQGTVKVPPLRRFDGAAMDPRSRRWTGGRRGNVIEYSRASRLRHLRHLARIRPDLMAPEPYMVTLTYPDEFTGKVGSRGSTRSDDLDPTKVTGNL